MLDTKITVEWPLLLSVPQVGATLCVGATTVRALVRAGELVGKKIGARLLIDSESVHSYVASLPATSSKEVGQ